MTSSLYVTGYKVELIVSFVVAITPIQIRCYPSNNQTGSVTDAAIYYENNAITISSGFKHFSNLEHTKLKKTKSSIFKDFQHLYKPCVQSIFCPQSNTRRRKLSQK